MARSDQKHVLENYKDIPLVGLINKKTNEIILAPCIPDKISVLLGENGKVRKIFRIGNRDLNDTSEEITGEARIEYERLLNEGFVPRVQYDASGQLKSAHELLFALNRSGSKSDWGGFAVTYSSKSGSQLKYTFASGGFNSQPNQRSRGALLSADLQAKVQEQLKARGKAKVRVIVNGKEELKRTPEEKISAKEIIEQMKRNKKDIWITEDKSQYFFKIDQSPAEPIFCTYEIKNNSLGQGLFGGVFKAQVLNAETGEAVPGQFIAIKEIPDEKFDPKEHKIASYEMRTGKLISSKDSKNGFNYIPLDFIDGAPIGDGRDNINKVFEEMNEEQLLDFIIDLLLECNEMHKNFIHCDLKGANILLQRISKAGQVSYKPRIVDWGLARPISSLKPGGTLGFQKITPSYAPCEAGLGFLDFYTDIYMISPVIANILGYYKYSMFGTLNEYSFEKKGLNSLGFDEFIHECMTCYLNRMRSTASEDRPNKDEPLKFFRLLKQLKKLNKLSDRDQNISEQINILKTKIYLLSKGISDYYDLCLMSDDTKPEKGKFYIRKKGNNSLEYTVLNPLEKPVTGEITGKN